MISRIKTQFLISLFVALFLVACGSDESKVASKSVASSAQLQYIPSDSPYAFAMLEPVPEPIFNKFKERLEPLLGAYRDMLDMVLQQEGSLKDMSDENRAALDFAMDKFLSWEGLNSIGFNEKSTSVIFGHGLLPVMRINLTDGDLMRGFIVELQEKFGEEFPQSEIAGQPYWHTPKSDTVQLLAAVIGDELVMTVVPSSGSETLYKSLLGLEKPSRSMASDETLVGIIESYNYLPYGVGFVDVTRIVDVFLSEQSGVNAELLAMGEYDSSKISEVCKTEIRAMAEIMPKMVTGYTRLTENEIITDLVLEIRSDLASSLSELAAPVPGVGIDNGGLFAFGAGFDIPKSIAFAKARIAAVEAEPYECEYFAEMQDGLDQMKTSLSAPMPPFVSGLKGFNMVFDGLEFDGTMPKPESIEARGIVAMDNAPAMLGMAQFFSPELANLKIEADGKPVALDPGMVPGLPVQAFVAMQESSIGISVGNGVESKLPGMMSANTKEFPPMMSISYDMDAYMDLILKFADLGLMEDENLTSADAEAAAKSMRQMLGAFQGMFDRTAMDIVFTDKGMKMEQYISMK